MIAGDIKVNLLDIELLTIKLRLVIASLDTASQVGINWWEADPWLSARRRAELRELGGAESDLDARRTVGFAASSSELEAGENGGNRATRERRGR